MSEKRLAVWWGGQRAGTLTQGDGGALSFLYAPGWQAEVRPQPLSQSMPVQQAPHGNDVCHAFFGGYLPADREIRAQLARIFETRKGDFALLTALGRDCAGALVIQPEEEAPPPDEARAPCYRLLEDWELADKLRELERQPLLAGPDGLRLSLAGAQSKTAVYVDAAGRIGLTCDNYPTSHIIKPEISDRLPDLALNEYLCMELARRVGLDVPGVELREAEGIPYLLIERYDRVVGDSGRVQRLHQEDFCQALGIPSETKYESEGGPTLRQCFDIVERLYTPAIERLRLLDVVIFHVLVGNTDAHGKNYSILYDEAGARLSPLYDVVCGAVYADEIDGTLAMKVGGYYESGRLLRRHWERFAESVGFSVAALRKRIAAMSRALQIHVRTLESDLQQGGQATDVSRRIVDEILRGAHAIDRQFDLPPIPSAQLLSRGGGLPPGETLEATDQQPAQDGGAGTYRRRYRATMTRLADERRRAHIAGDTKEALAWLDSSRRVSAAFSCWSEGVQLTSSQRQLLGGEVGPIPAS